MLFKGVLIGLELREFDRMCAMHLTKSRFGKNQSYEVLTLDRRYDSKYCSMNKISIQNINVGDKLLILFTTDYI